MLEALRALGVLSEGLWKNFDGNDSPEPRIDARYTSPIPPAPSGT